MVGEVRRKGQQFSPRPQTKSLVGHSLPPSSLLTTFELKDTNYSSFHLTLYDVHVKFVLTNTELVLVMKTCSELLSLFWGQRTTGVDQTAPSNRLSVENSIAGSQRFL